MSIATAAAIATNEIIQATLLCNACGEEKPLIAFWQDNRRQSRGRHYRNHYCIDCLNKKRKKYEMLADDDPLIVNGSRVCNKCGIEKGLVDYTRSSLYPLGRYLHCKACCNAWKTARTGPSRRKPPMQPTPRDYRRLKFLGVTASQFQDLYETQNGLCAVCGNIMGYLAKETCIDHDHKTGVIRGVLCQRCNLGLGHFKDNIKLLCQAVLYLEKHRN